MIHTIHIFSNHPVDGHVDDGVQCWVRACVHRQSVRGGRGGWDGVEQGFKGETDKDVRLWCWRGLYSAQCVHWTVGFPCSKKSPVVATGE